jgi:glutathionylspermidine synthase
MRLAQETLPRSRISLEPLRAGQPLEPKVFSAIRRQSALVGCKWDTQVGDVTTLAPFPLILQRPAWNQLAAWSEQLAAEAERAEKEVADNRSLMSILGFPRPLERVLCADTSLTPSAGRVIRFDFHHTSEGWRLSEANSDVPGGFTEASHFTKLIVQHYPDLAIAGDPAAIWCDTLASTANRGAIALLTAPGYMEDQQVTSFLAFQLRQRGCRTHLAKPEQLEWLSGRAELNTAWHHGPIDLIVRFYQAEWLSRLPAKAHWSLLFRGGSTPVANPALGVISENKRFPLLWPHLRTSLATWRALLPETRDPREVPWQTDDHWLVKKALSNTGDSVSIRALMTARDWLRTRLAVTFAPKQWLAQRRFASVPIATPRGPRHVCIGVYTINGLAAGGYARLAEKPLIDFTATDVALLIEND